MAPTAEAIRSDPKLVKRAVWLCGILGGLQTVDPIIASLALPKAGRGLHMTTSQLSLAASVSTLFLAATVVLLGALADRLGRRLVLRVLTIGLIAGDVIVAVAPATPVFMIGRAIAGICVGGVLATAYAFLRTVTPPERLGASLGLWGGICVGLSLPLAVIASGFASVSWRLAFVCVPAIAAACLPLEARILPRMAPIRTKKQLVGVSLAGLGVVGILYGVSQTANRLVSVQATVPLVLGFLLIAAAGIVGMRSKRPAFPVHIFRSPVFMTAAISGGLWNLSTGASQLQSSNLWQYVHGISPLSASLLQVPYTIAIAGGSVVVGRLLGRGGKPRVFIAGGFLVVALGLAVLAVTGASPLTVVFNLGLVAVGVGAGLSSVAQSQILLTEAPDEFIGPVAASRTSFGQIGYALGLAGSSVVTLLLTMRAMGTEDARTQLNAFLTSEHVGGASASSPVASAYTSGFQGGMWFWTVIFVLGAIVCFWLMSLRPRPLPGSAAAQVDAIADAPPPAPC